MPIHRARREVECVRNLRHRHAHEVAQLDEFSRRFVFQGEFFQSLVHSQQFVRRRVQHEGRFVQLVPFELAATFEAVLAPGMIHEKSG